MKSKLFSSFLALLFLINLNAQTNDRIKQESDQNRQQRESSQSRDYSRGKDSGNDLASDIAGGCAEGCINGGCLIMFDVMGAIFKGMAKANQNILAREQEVPRINSVELGCNVGFINPNSTLLMPSLKIRGGLLSTSLRVFSNTEKHASGTNNYSTINWQILQFNVGVVKEVNFSLGTGVLYETYSKQVFNEFGFGIEIFPKRFYIPVELRFTPDYKTGKTVLFETHTGIGYNLRSWQNATLRFQLNYTYGNYYEAVDVHGLSAGFVFLFDTGQSRIREDAEQ